jgi:hypothetical protein
MSLVLLPATLIGSGQQGFDDGVRSHALQIANCLRQLYPERLMPRQISTEDVFHR